MKAITTKFLPPTATLPARVKASEQDGQYVVVSWDQATDTRLYAPHSTDHFPHTPSFVELAHHYAALRLQCKMNWLGKLIGGSTSNHTYVWVWSQHHGSYIGAVLDAYIIANPTEEPGR